MRKMSKYAGLFEKYGNVDEDTERHLGRINWDGHIKINGTYSGSACMVGNKDSFIAKDLIKDSNPRGSILMEAKNYTDGKVKYLYNHFITLQVSSGSVYVSYISEYASQYTIATLKNALIGKTLVCSGYLNGSVAEYITSEGGNLSVGVVDVSDGSTMAEIIDDTFSITDEVSEI